MNDATAPMTAQQRDRYNFWRGCGWSLVLFAAMACCGACGVLGGLMYGPR